MSRYLDGLKDAENLYKECGYTIQGLEDYLQQETKLVEGDYRWNDWLFGFGDYILHIKEFKGIVG